MSGNLVEETAATTPAPGVPEPGGVVLDLGDVDDVEYLMGLPGDGGHPIVCLCDDETPVAEDVETALDSLSRERRVVVLRFGSRRATFRDCRGELHVVGPDLGAAVRGVIAGAGSMPPVGRHEVVLEEADDAGRTVQ